jgi:hypothetical protein
VTTDFEKELLEDVSRPSDGFVTDVDFALDDFSKLKRAYGYTDSGGRIWVSVVRRVNERLREKMRGLPWKEKEPGVYQCVVTIRRVRGAA